MANYAIAYQRPAKSLLKLRDELNSVFPGRFTGTDGFVSGYDGPNNRTYGLSGHNPNQLGHCMAFDISTPANGEQIDEATGRALADYLRLKANEKFKYLIHDQGPVAPEPRIAGDFSKWAWTVYSGVDHSDHIHISLTDDYQWGESCGLAQSVYDDESSWGIAAWYASYKGGTPAPAPKPNPAPVKPAPAPVKPVRKTYSNDSIHWVVARGDTLTKIAAYYGVPERIGAIAAHNGIDPNTLSVGDKIWIPGKLEWLVEGPDEIRTIAAYYGLDAGYLARLNSLSGPDATIYVGNRLTIQKG